MRTIDLFLSHQIEMEKAIEPLLTEVHEILKFSPKRTEDEIQAIGEAIARDIKPFVQGCLILENVDLAMTDSATEMVKQRYIKEARMISEIQETTI